VTPADVPARPALQVIDAGASPEEVAAIVAAVTAALAAGTAGEPDAEPASRWVTMARLRARRVGPQRGEWRLSTRMGSRSRT